MKVQNLLPLLMLSFVTAHAWSQPLGIPSLRVTGEDVESDQKVLWVEGENFYQGTCGVNEVFENMNKETCKIHTNIPLRTMKKLLKISHAESREAEVKLMIKEIDQAKKDRLAVAELCKNIQNGILKDVDKFSPEIGNLIKQERGTEKQLKLVITLLKPSANNPKAAALVSRATKELADFPARINSVLPYNSTSYVDSIQGNIRHVENSVAELEASKKLVPKKVKEVEDYLDILKAPLDESMVNTAIWKKYFNKFKLPTEVQVWSTKEHYDYSEHSWNFKVLKLIADYEREQVQKNKPVGYLAHLQRMNKPVSANGKQWAVVSRNHSLLGKKLNKKRRAFDYYYLTNWLDSDEVEANGISLLSPHMLYTCENVFGKGWRDPKLKEIEAAAVEIKRTALGDLIGEKRVLSSQLYQPHVDAMNTAKMFDMDHERHTNKMPRDGGARLCVK